MTEEALSMEEAKLKLSQLRIYLPNASSRLLYEYGRFLSEYLNPRLVPSGFVIRCELALLDLQNGIHGFTQEPIENDLVGCPPIIFTLLRAEIPDIAKAIFPKDFADQVIEFIEEVRAEKQRQKTLPPSD